MEKKDNGYRLSIRLPTNFYFVFHKMKEDAFKKGEKFFIGDLIENALTEYLKSHGYPEIACDN